jgi:hypothetical protein
MVSRINQILHKADIDIDRVLNRVVPAPPAPHKLHPLAARFLGYHQPKPIPDIVRAGWVLVSTFTGIILVMCTLKYGAVFKDRGSPEFIPSWAATAILIYNVVESPLGQPRSTFFGNFISTFVGICITKLFMLNSNNEQYLWVSGALCVGVASIVMSFTKTLHPPGGASALLCSIDQQVRDLGWFYLVIQIVSGLIMLAVACLFNNIQRRFPLYWWTPNTLRATGPLPSEVVAADVVAAAAKALQEVASSVDSTMHEKPTVEAPPLAHHHLHTNTLQRVLSDRHIIQPDETGDLHVRDLEAIAAAGGTTSTGAAAAAADTKTNLGNVVLILPTHYSLPAGLELTEEEEALLVNIQDQLKMGLDNDLQNQFSV